MTFCAPGITDENIVAGFYGLILEYLDAKSMSILGVNAFNASSLLDKVFLVISLMFDMFHQIALKPSLPVWVNICKTVYPNIRKTIKYTQSVNDAKPKLASLTQK